MYVQISDLPEPVPLGKDVADRYKPARSIPRESTNLKTLILIGLMLSASALVADQGIEPDQPVVSPFLWDKELALAGLGDFALHLHRPIDQN